MEYRDYVSKAAKFAVAYDEPLDVHGIPIRAVSLYLRPRISVTSFTIVDSQKTDLIISSKGFGMQIYPATTPISGPVGLIYIAGRYLHQPVICGDICKFGFTVERYTEY